VDARRETRRLIGDTILKQQDCEAGTMFPDRISYGGWSLDVHNPRGILSGKEGPYYFDGFVPIYSIPYRTIYSDQCAEPVLRRALHECERTSRSHGAGGGTLSVGGTGRGYGGRAVHRHDVSPRELGQRYIGELQQRLLRDDQYIPELANGDPSDLARARQR
jgi:hypothetical protein